MKRHPGPRVHPAFVLLVLLASNALAADGPTDLEETLQTSDGGRTGGRLEGDPAAGFRFVEASGTKRATPFEPGMTVIREGRGPSTAAGLPPFRVEMGLGQRLSGRLGAIDDREIRLLDVTGAEGPTIARGGARAVVQRIGESQVFQDGFDTLDTTRWTIVGEPAVVDEPRVAGDKALSIPAGGTSLTHRVVEPFEAGRLEAAFHDGGEVVAGQQWFVDLTFRAATGQQTIRVVLGWAEESLAVESPAGPALAVQRLARKPEWRRLSVRFGADLCEVAVDGNELAHGKGLGGPLVEVRLASFVVGKDNGPDDLAGHLDDLRLVRFDEPAANVEIDIGQDEARLTTGDQLFGKVRAANGERVRLVVDGRDLALPWADVAGLYFRRDAVQGAAVDGLLVRAEWRAASGTDPRDLNRVEGALTGLSTTQLRVATPYAGTVVIPRERLATLRAVGRGRRVVVDPMAHHLGDEISATEPVLDPPQPEGGVLERAVELADVPEGDAFLVLDVEQVVGEAADAPFSNLIKKGELRTNVKINGEAFDYINRHVASRNETPERVRLPIPRGRLRAGRNVIRFEQAGIASDATYFDDLGLLQIALEFAAPTDARPAP